MKRGNFMPSSILKQCVVYQRKNFRNLSCLLDGRRSLHNKISKTNFEVNLHFIFNAVVKKFSA